MMKPMPLRFDSTIPHFNACDTCITPLDGRVEAAFAADPHGGPECLWFCFRLVRHGPTPDATVLRLKHAYNMLGGGRPQHMRPVVCYAGQEQWQRLGAPEIHHHPDGRWDVLWTIDTPAEYVDVAWCYPYGRGDLDALIIDTKLKADVIGVSQLGRPIVRVCNGYGQADSSRPGMYVLARQHSGETSGSWMLDGFLRHLAEMGDAAPLVWAVPLSNIDGVEQGDYGKDNFPYDLNRAWGHPPMRHETMVMQQDIGRWKKRCRPTLVLDFHSPGACENDGVYAFMPNPQQHPEAHAATAPLAERIRQALGDDAAKDFARVAHYRSRWETPSATRGAWEAHRIPGFSFEAPYGLIGPKTLAITDYRQAGQRIAQAVAQHCAEGQ
jgi:hypothetical protein